MSGAFTDVCAQGIDSLNFQEFPINQVRFIQTWISEQRGQAPDTDDSVSSNPSHGTCTAAKAVSQNLGSAKKATLVVVKMFGLHPWELVVAFDLVAKDIRAKSTLS